MRIVTIQLPDEVNVSDRDLALIIASKLYEDGTLSAGKAAEIAGLSKRAFIEILGQYGVSVFGEDPRDLQADLEV